MSYECVLYARSRMEFPLLQVKNYQISLTICGIVMSRKILCNSTIFLKSVQLFFLGIFCLVLSTDTYLLNNTFLNNVDVSSKTPLTLLFRGEIFFLREKIFFYSSLVGQQTLMLHRIGERDHVHHVHFLPCGRKAR